MGTHNNPEVNKKAGVLRYTGFPVQLKYVFSDQIGTFTWRSAW